MQPSHIAVSSRAIDREGRDEDYRSLKNFAFFAVDPR